MIGAILFDVDGTLIDSNDLHAAAWDETFRHYGVELPFEAIRGQIGKGGDNLIPALLPPELVSEKQEEIEDYRSNLFKTCYLPRVVPFPHVRELFERLYADGIRIVLASSAKGAEVAYHLNVMEASDLVFATTSSDEVEHSKPCPDIFAAALEKVAPLGPDEVLVVGDTPYDIAAAAKLGVKAIAVRAGGFPDEELGDAVAIYEGPEDLLRRYPEWLGR